MQSCIMQFVVIVLISQGLAVVCVAIEELLWRNKNG